MALLRSTGQARRLPYVVDPRARPARRCGIETETLRLVYKPFTTSLWLRCFPRRTLMVMGFPLETLAGLLAFRGLWAIYIHSNGACPSGRCARSSARLNCTTDITPASARPATTPTSLH